MIMITVADSGNLSLMEALRDCEIQILGCSSCYHYSHANHHCANWSHQLWHSLKSSMYTMAQLTKSPTPTVQYSMATKYARFSNGPNNNWMHTWQQQKWSSQNKLTMDNIHPPGPLGCAPLGLGDSPLSYGLACSNQVLKLLFFIIITLSQVRNVGNGDQWLW